MKELGTALVLLVLAVIVLNPMHLWMPTMVVMLLLAALFAAFCAFALFVLREGAVDEREAQHRASAGRAAFLIGAAILVCGIVAQELVGALDPWLVFGLVGMVVGKFAARVYSERHY